MPERINCVEYDNYTASYNYDYFGLFRGVGTTHLFTEEVTKAYRERYNTCCIGKVVSAYMYVCTTDVTGLTFIPDAYPFTAKNHILRRLYTSSSYPIRTRSNRFCRSFQLASRVGWRRRAKGKRRGVDSE